MSLQLNFSDQLALIDLTEYDEASLLNHIKACHTIVVQLPSHFDISRRDDEKENNSLKSQKSQKSPIVQKTGQRDEKDSNIDSQSCKSIELSPAVTDSVRSACYSSAKFAVIHTVRRMGYSVQGLVDLLFIESHSSNWIGRP